MCAASSRSGLRGLAGRMAVMLSLAGVLGLAFNLAAPQGIGRLPESMARPLWREVTAVRAAELARGGALLVDARDPGVYKQDRLRGAVNLYPDELSIIWPLLKDTLRTAPAVVVYGRSVSRWPAADIGQFLRRQGLDTVYVTGAGLEDLTAAGLPAARARRRPS